MELKDIIGWVITLVVAVIGVSSIAIKCIHKNSSKNVRNNISQTIANGDGNIQAGGDVHQSTQNDEV